MATRRPLSPHLTVYRLMHTMVFSVLHRATGVVLSVALVLLAGWLLALAAGPLAYARAATLFGSPPGLLLLLGLCGAFCYHLCNGIRHLVFDTGRCLEKDAARRSGSVMLFAALALTAVSALMMLRLRGWL